MLKNINGNLIKASLLLAGPSSGNSSGGGGVSSFQPTDERACNDNLLDMEACKISDGGKLNSGTAAEPFF